MLSLEQPNQEALLQEFKGLCGTVYVPQPLCEDQVRVCELRLTTTENVRFVYFSVWCLLYFQLVLAGSVSI